MHGIGPCELEDIDVVIHLENKETICPIGILRDVEVLCGKIKYPADFLVLYSATSKTCTIIFGRPFLNTCGAIIDCKKEKVLTKFDGDSYEFNFSKFAKAPCENSLPNKDFRMEQLASIDSVMTLDLFLVTVSMLTQMIKLFPMTIILSNLFKALLRVIMREGNTVLCISIILSFPILC